MGEPGRDTDRHDRIPERAGTARDKRRLIERELKRDTETDRDTHAACDTEQVR